MIASQRSKNNEKGRQAFFFCPFSKNFIKDIELDTQISLLEMLKKAFEGKSENRGEKKHKKRKYMPGCIIGKEHIGK